MDFIRREDMNRQLFVGVAFGVLVLAGCSSQKVNFDYDRQTDFSKYTTYAWHEGEHTIADEDPFAHQRFVAAVDRELAAVGFQKNRRIPTSMSPTTPMTRRAPSSIRTTSTTATAIAGIGAGAWAWVAPPVRCEPTRQERSFSTCGTRARKSSYGEASPRTQ